MTIIDPYRHLVCRWLPGLITGIIIGVHLLAEPAFAADETGGWRSTYDEIMRWVNFGIFAFVIVKFTRKPLVDFLNSRKTEVAEEIHQVERQKRQADEAVAKIVDQLAQSSQRLEEIKARIVDQGERRKHRIITEAKEESDMLINAAQVKIRGQIANARNRLRSEIIDEAIDMALKRLPTEVTPADDTQMVNDYLKQALPE